MSTITVVVTLSHKYLMARTKARLWDLFYEYRDAVTQHENKAPREFMAPPKDAGKSWLAHRILQMARRLPE